MNPFGLPDLQFLAFYAALFVVALVAAGLLRFQLRQPSDEPSEEAARIGAYEMAYLFGGRRHAIDAVIARFVQDRVLALDAVWRRLTPGSEPLAQDASELERAVYEAVPQGGKAVWRVRWAVSDELAPIKRRLQDLGLLMTDDRAARVFPFAIMALVLVVGVIKYFVGFSGQVDSRFLVMCWLMSVFVAVGSFAFPLPRSRRGDRLLIKLRQDHAELGSQVKLGANKLSGREMALVVGLFGAGLLNESPKPEMAKVLTNSQPMRLESHADLWVPILAFPIFGGLFATVPLVGTPAEDNLLSPFWIVVVIYAFFGFSTLMLALPRFEELVRREAWVPPGTAAYPAPVALALCALVMAATAGLMLTFMWIVQLVGG